MMDLLVIDLIGENNLGLKLPNLWQFSFYTFFPHLYHFLFTVLPWAIVLSVNILFIAVFFRHLERMSLSNHTGLECSPQFHAYLKSQNVTSVGNRIF